MKLLHIDSSILGEASASRALTHAIVARWKEARPDAQVIYRDLAAQELPHLTHAALSGANELEAARNAAVLQEFLDADAVVLGAPMYNFTLPSQLKAWVDRVTVAGKTFRSTDQGPEGLAGGKQVVVALSRGGSYPPGSPAEFVESYLKFLFGFLGVTDVTFVRAEGLALSSEHREAALRAAHDAIPVAPALAA
jgi:FMN-dependent NADH-azoreductase